MSAAEYLGFSWAPVLLHRMLDISELPSILWADKLADRILEFLWDHQHLDRHRSIDSPSQDYPLHPSSFAEKANGKFGMLDTSEVGTIFSPPIVGCVLTSLVVSLPRQSAS